MHLVLSKPCPKYRVVDFSTDQLEDLFISSIRLFQIHNKGNLVGCLEENELIFECWEQEGCQLLVEFVHSSSLSILVSNTITMSGHHKEMENGAGLVT